MRLETFDLSLVEGVIQLSSTFPYKLSSEEIKDAVGVVWLKA